MPGEGHPLPSISSQGKVEMLIQSFQRCKPPIPWWLSGRGQGDQQKLGLGGALGSWASLPSKTAQANSSLCLQWGGGIGASIPGDCLPKFFHALLGTGEIWCLALCLCSSPLLQCRVWQEGCKSCTGDQLCISFCFAPAEGDTPPLPPIPPEVMTSLGRGACGFGMK